MIRLVLLAATAGIAGCAWVLYYPWQTGPALVRATQTINRLRASGAARSLT